MEIRMRGRMLMLWTFFALSLAPVQAEIGDFSSSTCAVCAGLEYCTAMNGKMLFDPVEGYTR